MVLARLVVDAIVSNNILMKPYIKVVGILMLFKNFVQNLSCSSSKTGSDDVAVSS